MKEAAVAEAVLVRLGLTPLTHFADDEYLEGGDVLPVTFRGKRVLLVGFGVRTTKAAAIKLALDLIPKHVDYVIGLMHDPDLLHLDTGFTVLPNKVILAAGGMFGKGFLIDEERRLQDCRAAELCRGAGLQPGARRQGGCASRMSGAICCRWVSGDTSRSTCRRG